MTGLEHRDDIVRALAESAEVEPPRAIDLRVREALAAGSATLAPPPPSLVFTSAVALAAYVAVVLGAGIALAARGLGSAAPALTFAMATVYLIVCAAASFPLLLGCRPKRRKGLREARS